MRFIRDIISERKSAKPESVLSSRAMAPRDFEARTAADHFEVSNAPRPSPFILTEEQAVGSHAHPFHASADANLFADEFDETEAAFHEDGRDHDAFDLPRTEEFAAESDPEMAEAAGFETGDYQADDMPEEFETSEYGANPFEQAEYTQERPVEAVQVSTLGRSTYDGAPRTPLDQLKSWGVQRKMAEVKPSQPAPQPERNLDTRLRMAMTASAPVEAPRQVPTYAAMKTPVAEPSAQRGLGDMPFVAARDPEPGDEMLTDVAVQVPPPAAGRGANRSGRVKTRLLGFNPESLGVADPFKKAESHTSDQFPIGWIVVVAGPGRGASFPLHDGVSKIGRGEDQTISLNFGDNSISRENHVAIAYDSEQNAVFIGQSGRTNIVRLNNKPLLSTEQLRSGDQVRVGETTLRLVTLCGDGFSWADKA